MFAAGWVLPSLWEVVVAAPGWGSILRDGLGYPLLNTGDAGLSQPCLEPLWGSLLMLESRNWFGD